eukprot:1673773-Pyramimonas_sp.AAC.1
MVALIRLARMIYADADQTPLSGPLAPVVKKCPPPRSPAVDWIYYPSVSSGPRKRPLVSSTSPYSSRSITVEGPDRCVP